MDYDRFSGQLDSKENKQLGYRKSWSVKKSTVNSDAPVVKTQITKTKTRTKTPGFKTKTKT